MTVTNAFGLSATASLEVLVSAASVISIELQAPTQLRYDTALEFYLSYAGLPSCSSFENLEVFWSITPNVTYAAVPGLLTIPRRTAELGVSYTISVLVQDSLSPEIQGRQELQFELEPQPISAQVCCCLFSPCSSSPPSLSRAHTHVHKTKNIHKQTKHTRTRFFSFSASVHLFPICLFSAPPFVVHACLGLNACGHALPVFPLIEPLRSLEARQRQLPSCKTSACSQSLAIRTTLVYTTTPGAAQISTAMTAAFCSAMRHRRLSVSLSLRLGPMSSC